MISGKMIKAIIGLTSIAGLAASYIGDWAKEKQEEEKFNQKFDERFNEKIAALEGNFEEIEEDKE